ncbi:NAD-P-binding protein [Russula emetica]|nr:NAD-P-binding protein [Russula emetica]
MSGYTKFAVVGAGSIGSYIIQQLLKNKAAGIVKEVVVLTRQGSKTTIQGDAKVIQVDYNNKTSINTVPIPVLDIQEQIAAAAKEVDVKLFVPSEYGGLKALGMPYATFYTGPWADFAWKSTNYLDVPSGKVSVSGDGNKQISFTSRVDVARYMCYVLTHLSPEQLKNRSFAIAGDNKSFNEIFKAYEERTGKKLQVTHIPVSELDARLAANQKDFLAYVLKFWATAGPFQRTENHLYPDWNPSPVIDHVPVA